ncbi:uncharacterized protein LOC144744493 [Ciona intestinalis]
MFSVTIENHAGAKSACIGSGGHLAIIPDVQTQIFLQTKGAAYKKEGKWMTTNINGGDLVLLFYTLNAESVVCIDDLLLSGVMFHSTLARLRVTACNHSVGAISNNSLAQNASNINPSTQNFLAKSC